MSDKNAFVREIGKCELCGSKRNLQLHHLIPMVCENDSIKLDCEDNWLCVCGTCHALLTPKNLLTKYGLSKAKEKNKTMMFYKDLEKRCIACKEEGIAPDIYDVLDVFDSIFKVEKEKYLA